MRKLFTKALPPSLAIDVGQVVSLHTNVAETLQVTCGRVWVTVAGQSDDYWLGAGQYLNVAAGSYVVLEADKGRSVVEVRQLPPTAICAARSVRCPQGAFA
ncbi:DUF2917 domain-containing protein [Glaciimonas sp. GG7]